MEQRAKRARIDISAHSARSLRSLHMIDELPGSGQQGLVIMVLDVDEGPSGSFHIWGRTYEGCTVLVQVHDYCPYLYVPAPVRHCGIAGGGVRAPGNIGEPPASAGLAGQGAGPGVSGPSPAAPDWSATELEALRNHWNNRLPPECRIQSIAPVVTRPIMYFRPDAPGGSTYLRLTLRPGGSSKRAAAGLGGLLSGREAAALESALGMRFPDRAIHEAEVKLLMRYLCDSSLSGGAWFYLPRAGSGSGTYGVSGGVSMTPAAAGYTPVADSARISTCDFEVVAPWRTLQSLTPDATQLADPTWCPEIVRRAGGCGSGEAPPSASVPPAVAAAAAAAADSGGRPAATATAAAPLEPPLAAAVLAARDGSIAPLTVMTVDVLSVPYDTTNRTPVTSKDDPVVCIACDVRAYGTASTAGSREPAAASDGAEALGPAAPPGGGGGGSSGSGPGGSSKADGNAGDRGHRRRQQSLVVFLLSDRSLANGPPLPPAAMQGAELRCFGGEGEMLLAWKDWLVEQDPDIIATFQVRDTLGALRNRFERLRLEGGGLLASRLAPASTSAAAAAAGGGAAAPLTVKSVVMYSVAWVKNQGRMSSNSNQETFRAEIRGRIVVDVLRQVLTGQSLATFSLVDCCQSILGETLEVLGPFHLARLAAEAQGRQALPVPAVSAAAAPTVAPAPSPAAAAARMASYLVRRIDVIVRLMARLATLPEAFEMARVTGLTIPQVMYNAQMIRTWSLLHRNAHRQNYIIGGRQEATNLIESPFLLHPIENKTAGLYRTPVATLDFASLYPSLYRAHNLCYCTLVHPDDLDRVGRERCGFTPTGHAFVKPGVRPGILPTILAALMVARTATRAALKDVSAQNDAAATAVLESRQKALKVTANALYGFTGAGASPLQCVPLADSCLALGAAACRGAIEAISAALAEGPSGPLGPGAEGGRVIYAQTDSVFVHFPRATPQQAVRLGHKAAALVTSSLPPPMELKYEKVLCPFLLLHVNRYAGRALEGEADAADPAGRGKLLVKGVRSMWRQSAPIVSEVLQGCLERILLHDDVASAVSYAEGQIRQLLSGRVELGELAMTGGLWRITGQQVAAAAAEIEGGGAPSGGNGGGAGGAGGAGGPPPEDVRGPHASLAVRLNHRDPGRRFVLGERLSYVLLAGARTQDEAAEDPLAAAQRGAAPALELYWRNKLQPPLKELFAACLSPAALQALLSGPHTLVRVDASVDATASQMMTYDSGTEAAAVAGATLLAGPGSPSPRRPGGGGGFGLAMTPRSPPNAGKGRGGGKQQLQSGLSHFFKQTAKCLACKQALPQPPGSSADVATAPGLCAACLREADTLPATYLRFLDDDNTATVQLASAISTCMTCHSGGHMGPILCENGECGVLFTRLGAARRLAAAGEKVARLARCEAAGPVGLEAEGPAGLARVGSGTAQGASRPGGAKQTHVMRQLRW